MACLDKRKVQLITFAIDEEKKWWRGQHQDKLGETKHTANLEEFY